MKYYLIAGERSGDLHASNVMKAILKHDKSAEFRFQGGDYMQEVGGKMIRHYKDIAFMGINDVVANYSIIKRAIKDTKADINSWRPDVLLCIDYAGFNLRVAKYAKQIGITTVYYISPKFWAWGEWRVNKVKGVIDRMYCIMPFEPKFYRSKGYHEAIFVGNPLLDALKDFQPNNSFAEKLANDKQKPIIALLPGSRKQEVKIMLDIMLRAIEPYRTQHYPVIAAVPNLEESFYKELSDKYKIDYVVDQTYDLLNNSHAAIVTSGTATLETALFEVPQVVAYRTNFITALLGKLLIRTPFISLVNLIAEKKVVTELLQYEVTAKKLGRTLLPLLEDTSVRNQQLKDYKELKNTMGNHNTSEKVGKDLVSWLSDK